MVLLFSFQFDRNFLYSHPSYRKDYIPEKNIFRVTLQK